MLDLTKLNPPQREAVLATQGPLLVLAGAGSGKTRVLTYRIAHLIQEGVPAWRILAITFTNKAAREMGSRVAQLCGEAAQDAWISTFHACCARILRRDIEKLGYKRAFTIYDDDDQSTLIKRLLKEMDLSDKQYSPRLVKTVISGAKNAMLTPQEWLDSQQDRDQPRTRNLYQLYEGYEKRLKACDALDFDDLLIKTLALFAEHPPVLESYQARFDYVLVDEYQDTNRAQYELVRLIAGQKRNLCVVGDDDQSIYGWRGADLRNILDFEKDYPDAKVVKLEQNYRSTGNILTAANQVIAHNQGRKEKALWTQAEDGEKIQYYQAVDEQDEAAWICGQVSALKAQGLSPGGCAVLYRANAQSRVIEEALVRSGIPYRVYGGLKFYDRKEVKDVVAYLRALVNPDDDISLLRIINEPRRGIGESTIDKLRAYAQEQQLPLYVAVMDYMQAGLGGRAALAVAGFAQVLEKLMVLRFEQTPQQFVKSVLEVSGYLDQYKKEKNDQNQQRLENIDELVGAVGQYQQQNPQGGLEGFLENVALVTDLDSMPEEHSALTLMTIHSAKGLEFPAVFVAGMEECVFPITRAVYDEKELEEERRLCYVALTRARKRLYLSCAHSRTLFGQRQSNPPSRFLGEIPQRLIQQAGLRAGSASRPEWRPSRAAGPGPAGARQHGAGTAAPGRGSPSARGQGRGQRQSWGGQAPAGGNALGIPGLRKGFVPSAARQVEGVQLFSQGDRVLHRFFGKGVVTQVTGVGDQARVTVAFDQSGERTFPAATAPIVKAR
ncbi:MAG TPA: UvrD-helicase domain-containing protein [Candidatus Excrementavichristensenella intestinipullorum]|nr:UvrD-helicase domain-containing protein [Candidatus Excrementavichristensenella intestinipullorum]